MKIGRNDPCPCGSGKKYKKCCIDKDIDFNTIQVGNSVNGEQGNGKVTAQDPLLQQLNTMMQEGYSLYDKNENEKAVETWWEVWQKTVEWFAPKNISSVDELDQLTNAHMAQSYFNWVQDFEMALSRAGNKDSKYLEMAYEYTTDFRKRLPNSKPLILMNMGTTAAEALFLLERHDEGEVLFEQLTKEKYKPEDKIWIYIRWGDCYTKWMKTGIVDPSKARMLYEKALEIATNERDRETINERIQDLAEH